jgi:MerR family transcriptional regulator, light-induced transcriptional regulator
MAESPTSGNRTIPSVAWNLRRACRATQIADTANVRDRVCRVSIDIIVQHILQPATDENRTGTTTMGILIKAPTRLRDTSAGAREANESSAGLAGALHIREVVRTTGLRREQLYMWQRRYGFPTPLRDAFGDRVYPPDQVARLKLIKQLLSEGWRAGAVVPLADSALQSMLGLTVSEPAPLPGEIETSVRLLGQHRIGELQNHLSKLLVGLGLRKFLEQTLIPLNEAVHERVVRGEMENYQELRFGDLAQRLLRDVTRLVRPTRDARQILLATPPNDPNVLGLAILELLLFTEGINCLTLGAGVPAQEIAGAARAYKVNVVVLLFDRGISGKIAGQEIRGLRTALPEALPLIVSGRAVNLLAKPIADVRTAADFSSIMTTMREMTAASPAVFAPVLPEASQRA